MLDAVLSLARPAVRKLVAYSSARSLATGAGAVFLDANENPWGADGVNRYPEPQPGALLDILSMLYVVPRDAIFVGRGTDDAIDALTRAFCEAGTDAILTCPPTYGMYEVSARLQGAEVIEVPTLPENLFAIDVEAILASWTPAAKLVYICSPNNPTGNLVPNETIRRLARALYGKAVVVVDEAYIEFAKSDSFVGFLEESPNVVVLRTLSKAWGLAGARCGAAIAHPDVIRLLQKVRAPYPISAPSLKVVLEAMAPERRKAALDNVDRLISERSRLESALGDIDDVELVFPSDANYLLLKVRSAKAVMDRCRAKGVVIRDRSKDYGLRDCVRITVGSPWENDLLLDALREGR